VALIPVNSVLGAAKYLSFNPCFSGSGVNTKSPTQELQERLKVSILVFLEVALIHKFWSSINNALFSFNPCFSGSGVNTSLALITNKGVFEFQSLFFWKWR